MADESIIELLLKLKDALSPGSITRGWPRAADDGALSGGSYEYVTTMFGTPPRPDPPGGDGPKAA